VGAAVNAAGIEERCCERSKNLEPFDFDKAPSGRKPYWQSQSRDQLQILNDFGPQSYYLSVQVALGLVLGAIS
jgi:hypothetical protein